MGDKARHAGPQVAPQVSLPDHPPVPADLHESPIESSVIARKTCRNGKAVQPGAGLIVAIDGAKLLGPPAENQLIERGIEDHDLAPGSAKGRAKIVAGRYSRRQQQDSLDGLRREFL